MYNVIEKMKTVETYEDLMEIKYECTTSGKKLDEKFYEYDLKYVIKE